MKLWPVCVRVWGTILPTINGGMARQHWMGTLSGSKPESRGFTVKTCCATNLLSKDYNTRHFIKAVAAFNTIALIHVIEAIGSR